MRNNLKQINNELDEIASSLGSISDLTQGFSHKVFLMRRVETASVKSSVSKSSFFNYKLL